MIRDQTPLVPGYPFDIHPLRRSRRKINQAFRSHCMFIPKNFKQDFADPPGVFARLSSPLSLEFGS